MIDLTLLQPGERFEFVCRGPRMVARIGFNHDWAAYELPASCTSEEVATVGHKMLREEAEITFPQIVAAGLELAAMNIENADRTTRICIAGDMTVSVHDAAAITIGPPRSLGNGGYQTYVRDLTITSPSGTLRVALFTGSSDPIDVTVAEPIAEVLR